MFLIERSVLPPRSRPRTSDAAASDGPAVPGTSARTPPVPATFLERAAGGAFELFPRRQFAGAGALIQAALPNPLLASLLPERMERPAPASLPPVRLPAAHAEPVPRRRRSA